jgi:hypothetical protein
VTTYLVVCSTAAFAALLTFFSGFGLGTLLMPAFALFFPIEQAVALAAVVHFLNGVFKLTLMRRHIDGRIYRRFGVPAMLGALAGAGLLMALPAIPPIHTYIVFEAEHRITVVKLLIGLLLLGFAALELVPASANVSFSDRWLIPGGVLSGFFGGLSGMQGALRAAFLARAGMTKERFVATGSAIACTIDAARLAVYAAALAGVWPSLDRRLLIAAVVSAFVGTLAGKRFLKKIEMRGVQRIVGGTLMLVALGLATGWL